jgi:hypothetical protein
MRRGNDWERRFGRRRRAIDRAVLEAAERAIAAEEGAYAPAHLDALASRRAGAEAEALEELERRVAIARAFGRPAD